MSAVYYRSKKGLNKLLEDHTPEGVSVLTSQPSAMMRLTIRIMAAALIVALIWSFFGRVDIVVGTVGTVSSEIEQQGIYSPIKGELVEVYVAEGMPVAKGDVVFRVNSPNAIEFAGQATQAVLQLAQTERAFELFPIKKKAMQKELDAIKAKLDSMEKDHQSRSGEALAKLAEDQQLKLQKARNKLAKAQGDLDQAKRVLDQYERLLASPGGGGVSREQVSEKRKLFDEKRLDYQLAETELGDFEVAMTKDYDTKREDIEKKSQDTLAIQSQYETAELRIVQEEEQIQMDLRLARAKARSASRVSYEDIDEDNYLRIRAPVDGVVTNVAYAQLGSQTDEKTPIASIVPKGTRKVLEIEINERDRAFLKPGMPVKIKLNAFPYQRYGVLQGELEHIAPTTVLNQQSKLMVYKARVGLKRDYFTVDKTVTPLQFGMAAVAEIVVERRRIIDLALDPFKDTVG